MARPRLHVLIVDDDAATRDGLVALLESWGYRATAAPDGKAALSECDKELPHAVVTDLMMPGMSGLEFIMALGEREIGDDRVRQLFVAFAERRLAVGSGGRTVTPTLEQGN